MKICVKPVVDEVLRSILKPVSLFELSVQLSVTEELDAAVALKADGAAGVEVPPD